MGRLADYLCGDTCFAAALGFGNMCNLNNIYLTEEAQNFFLLVSHGRP